MTKSERKAYKKLAKGVREQIDDQTAGTMYTMDFMSGTVTKVEPKTKKKAKDNGQKESET